MWKLLFVVALSLHCAWAASPVKPPKKCAPKNYPPKCNDRNATTGCGENCGAHCFNLFNPPSNSSRPLTCQGRCQVGGCDCKKNYFQDDNQNGKCVLAEDCMKPACPNNEEFRLCPETCPPRTCATKDAEFKCAAPLQYPDPNCRPPGCQCLPGFYRNSTGSCVSKDQCTSCPKNEVYELCRTNCPPRTCATRNIQVKCIAPPVYPDPKCLPPGCRCLEGFYRNTAGACVTKEQCEIQTKRECTPTEDIDSNKESPTTAPSQSNGPKELSNAKEVIEKFNSGNAVFTGNFYAQVSKDQAGVSTIMSPYSLLFLLAQLALYADGVSFDQLIAALGLDSKDQIREVFPQLLDSIEAVQNVTFNLAAKTYNNKDFALSDGFEKDTREVFRAEAEALDCSNPAEAAEIVNDWVANKTNNKIQDILSSDAISEMTRIILANALYFKGNWKQQFNKNLTQDRDFTLEDEQVIKVKTMYREGTYRYGYSNELACEALEMTYNNEDFSFTIYLPQLGGLATLQEKMHNSSVVTNFRKSLVSQKIRIYIPTFKTETTINLVQLLTKIGITNIFDKSGSGLSGLLAKPEDVYVSDGIQKAFIEVNEEGAEAAAANVLVVRTTSVVINPPEPLVFRANRAFAYEIRRGDVTVFLGTYAGK